jgi:hypothetical protein
MEPIYNLPEDLIMVKMLAFTRAHTDAYLALASGITGPDKDLRTQALGWCLVLEQTSEDGKQGANDLPLFRETFVEAYAQHYPKAINEMQSGTLKIAPGLSVVEQLTRFHQLSKDYYGVL